MKLILLGAPGAGKGTLSEIINEKFNVPIISTGNIIRKVLKTDTELGKTAKKFVDEGKLVPDEIVVSIVKESISKSDSENNFILDGFPRTVVQAEMLEKMGIFIDKVINLEVDDEVICQRMLGRRICENCETVYNVNTDKKPKIDEICDKCGQTLIKRKDDEFETIKTRIKVYYSQTAPLIDYYKKIGKLVSVVAHTSIDNITQKIIEIIEGIRYDNN